MPDTPLRAFFLGGRGILGGCALHAWLDAGHRIVEYWTTDLASQKHDNRFVDWFCPTFSTASALRRAGTSPNYYQDKGGASALERAISSASPDVLISIGFGRRLKVEIIKLLPDRCVNLHPTLLPVCRGPTPILSLLFDACMNDAGGMTMHLIDKDLDTGAIVGAMATPPDPSNNPLRYHVETARLAGRLLVDVLPRYLNGQIEPRAQDEGQANFRRVSRNDLIIRTDTDPGQAEQLALTVPWITRLNVEVGGRLVPIDGVIGKLPASSVTASRAGWRHVDVNFGGEALRFRRRTELRRQMWKLRRMAFLLRA